jgi:carboxylate-amine ligase
VRHIVERGTSAHRQLKTFELEIANGADVDQALRAVVDRLIEDTTTGL